MKTTAFTLFVLATQSFFLLLPSPEETAHYHHLRCGSDFETLLHHQPPLVVFYEFDEVDERLGAFRLLLEPQLEAAAEPEEDDDDKGIYFDRSYEGDWDPNDPVENPFGIDLPNFIDTDPEYSDVEEYVPDYYSGDRLEEGDRSEEDEVVPHYYDVEEEVADEDSSEQELVDSPVWDSSPICDPSDDEGGDGIGKQRFTSKLKKRIAGCFFFREQLMEVEEEEDLLQNL